MINCINGTLGSLKIKWKKNTYSTCITVADKGYPVNVTPGQCIKFSEDSDLDNSDNFKLYHANTKDIWDKACIYTTGGRVFSAVSTSTISLIDATRDVYRRLNRSIYAAGNLLHYRTDIGIDGMKEDCLNVGVLGSTNGTTLELILEAKKEGLFPNINFSIIISNVPDAGILKKAKKYNMQHSYIPYDSEEDVDNLLKIFTSITPDIDVVLLIGFMKILPPKFLKYIMCINIHPSLLPDFTGKMGSYIHAKIIEEKRKWAGCTAHLVSTDVDKGAPLWQIIVPVVARDTPETLKDRVQHSEMLCLEKALSRYAQFDKEFFTKSLTYERVGVSIDKAATIVNEIKALASATKTNFITPDIGSFGALTKLGNEMLVSSTDGVGTKLNIALELNMLEYVGYDLVAMCANDVLSQGAKPMFMLDYLCTVGHMNKSQTLAILRSITNACKEVDIALVGGELAEHPILEGNELSHTDVHLAGFVVGRIFPGLTPLPKDGIKDGDILVGIGSSGCHSNGYSLIRKCVERSGLGWSDKSPWNPDKTISQELLQPSTIYVKIIEKLIENCQIKAIAHITGGGLEENIMRVVPKYFTLRVDYKFLNEVVVQPIFKWIQYSGQISSEEMYHVFNMGIGMVLVIDPKDKDDIFHHIQKHDMNVYDIGFIQSSS